MSVDGQAIGAYAVMEWPIVDDDPVADLRAEQQRLAALLDEFDDAPADTAREGELLQQIADRVAQTVTVRAEVPVRQGRTAVARYGPRTRLAAAIATGSAVLVGLAVLPGWISAWSLLVLIPLAVVSGWLVVTTAGDPVRLAASDEPFLRWITSVGLVGGVLCVLLAGLLSGWFLPGALLAAAGGLATLTAFSPTVNSIVSAGEDGRG